MRLLVREMVMSEQIRSRRRARFRRRALTWTGGLVIAAAIGVGAQVAAEPDMVTRKTRLRGIEDPNVKAASDVNVRSKPSGVPPAGKAPNSLPVCSVTFDNHTDLITKTYIDGGHAGTVRPYGQLSVSIVPGSAVLYARAEYDDGSADAWGPIRISCRTKYLWRLAD
jgi:hypothetical protein